MALWAKKGGTKGILGKRGQVPWPGVVLNLTLHFARPIRLGSSSSRNGVARARRGQMSPLALSDWKAEARADDCKRDGMSLPTDTDANPPSLNRSLFVLVVSLFFQLLDPDLAHKKEKNEEKTKFA